MIVLSHRFTSDNGLDTTSSHPQNYWLQFLKMGNPANKNTSLINNYAHQLRTAVSELGCSAPENEIESISIFLLRIMGSELRDYHKPEHSIDVSLGQPPVARIASLFHDCVYVQVDPGWRNSFSELFQTLMAPEAVLLNVKEALARSEIFPWFKTITLLFGLENETALRPVNGLNEFLSALVMVKKMEGILKPIDLLKAAACIEATIPFRKLDANGNSASQGMRLRLPIAAKQIAVIIAESDIIQTTLECRGIVESDLGGFGSERLSYFISNTWNVMNENNPSLRNSFFLVSDYRKAVYGIIGFLQSLNPDHMFWSDVQVQSVKNARLVERARYNLKNGVEYLKALGLSLSIVEAIALETGGDAPFEFFFGSLKKSREHTPLELEELLAVDPHPSLESDDQRDVYRILKDGREMRAKFDRKKFPLGAFLYTPLQRLGQFELFFQAAAAFHKGQGSAKELLQRLPKELRAQVLSSIAQLATTRGDKISALNV